MKTPNLTLGDSTGEPAFRSKENEEDVGCRPRRLALIRYPGRQARGSNFFEGKLALVALMVPPGKKTLADPDDKRPRKG